MQALDNVKRIYIGKKMTLEMEIDRMLENSMKDLEKRIEDEILFEIEVYEKGKYIPKIPDASGDIDIEAYHKSNEEAIKRICLQKCQYNLTYTIDCLRQIMAIVDRYKLSPRDLPITLKHSIEKMVAFLEVEKENLQ